MIKGGLKMFRKKRSLQWMVTGLFILVAVILIGSPAVQAQYWTPIPPYNLLWPLWSPALSPPDPVTGVPTPLVSYLTQNTILPAQPAIFWDPAYTLPYLLYNIPIAWGGGMLYLDPYFGLESWPPPYLLDPITGAPAPISLPAGFGALSPLDVLTDLVYYGNLLYTAQYPFISFGVQNQIIDLLTPGEIWGLDPLI
jgi:hypothetical protein